MMFVVKELTAQLAGTRQMVAVVARYGVATAGPLAVSAAHFVASIALLRVLEPAEFGLFAFLLIVVQFALGLSNALIGAPFTVNANRHDHVVDPGLFFKINLLLSLGIGLSVGAVAWAMGAGTAALYFALYAALAVLRWFFRSYLFARHRSTSVAFSDVGYAIILMAGMVVAWSAGITLETASAAFLAAALMALLAGGGECLRLQFCSCLKARLSGYRNIWVEQSRWSLLGVASTEVASNAHIWLVTIIFGPAAFAPLAAAALLFRPVSLVAASLTQLERPVMARAWSLGNTSQALSVMLNFRYAMVIVWSVTAIVAFVTLANFPSVIIKDSYHMSVVMTAAVLQSGISALNAWRTPDGAFVQAANRFKALARVSVLSSAIAIPGVIVILLLFEPVWSLIAILLTQMIMAKQISKLVRKLERQL